MGWSQGYHLERMTEWWYQCFDWNKICSYHWCNLYNLLESLDLQEDKFPSTNSNSSKWNSHAPTIDLIFNSKRKNSALLWLDTIQLPSITKFQVLISYILTPTNVFHENINTQLLDLHNVLTCFCFSKWLYSRNTLALLLCNHTIHSHRNQYLLWGMSSKHKSINAFSITSTIFTTVG